MDERASTKRALAATPSPSRRRRRRVTGSSPGCVPRAAITPVRAFRTPPPRCPLPPTSGASSTPGLPRAPRSTPALRLDDDDDAFSVISGDGSPERDSHVLDFLALGDGAQAFTLFTPSPAAPKTARALKHELSTGLLTPQASPVRSAKSVSPSHFFRSPFNKSRSNSAAASPLHLQLMARDRGSKTESTDDEMLRDEEIGVHIKSEPLLDVTVSRAGGESRSTSSTPSSSSSGAWRRNSLSLMRTPSPATSARARAIRTKTQLLLSAGRDPFASSDDEAESPRKSRRLLHGREDDNEFNRPPSAASGANDQDWLFSFANTLSPLAHGRVNDEDLETSFMTLRFSPAVPSSIDLQRLLPPFPSPGLGPSEPTNIFRTATTPKSPFVSKSSSPPPSTRTPDASKSLSESTNSASTRERSEPFPNIRASTSATPGRDERLKVSNSSVMKMKLHVTFDQFPPSHTKREIEAINNSIKRRKNSRKRKLEDSKQRHIKINSKGLNVQRKLLQTPVKEDGSSTEVSNINAHVETKGKVKTSKNRTTLQGLHGRSAQRKILDAVVEVADKSESTLHQPDATGKPPSTIAESNATSARNVSNDDLNTAIRRRVSATLVSVSTATLPSNLAAAVSTPTLQPLKLRKPAVNSRSQPPSSASARSDVSLVGTTKLKSSTEAPLPMKPMSLSTVVANEEVVPPRPLPPPSSISDVSATLTPAKPQAIAKEKPATETTPLPASKGGFLANPKILSTPTQQAAVATPPALGAGPGGTAPKKKTPCNCKKSKCLKLYCECFASGGYCDESCNCVDCANTPASEAVRQQAIASRLEKNPNAFKPKIESTVAVVSSITPSGGINHQVGAHGFTTPNNHHHHTHGQGIVSGDVKKMHKHGCHCKKSACQKRYCECFQAGVPCGDNCRCIECKNQSPYVAKNANMSTPLSAISIRGPASRDSTRTNVPLAAGTPGANADLFVSPPVPSIRQRLRIDRETWARNFSSPFEVSPRRERERTERLRAQLRNSRASALVRTFASGTQPPSRGEVTIKTEPGLTAGASTSDVRSTSTSFGSPTECSVVTSSMAPRSLSPLSDAFRPPPAPTPLGKDGHMLQMKRFVPHNPHAIEALAIGRKTSGRVYVLPLFGDDLPPVKTEVSAKIFHFLTNADVYNASLVNRLWSRVTMGDSVWDHHNFRRLPSHILADAEVTHHQDHGDVAMQD